MATNPKTRKAPAADPIFALIAEHKTLIKELDRLEDNYRTGFAQAEKTHGKRPDSFPAITDKLARRGVCEWLG
jgi:hypothetical protein